MLRLPLREVCGPLARSEANGFELACRALATRTARFQPLRTVKLDESEQVKVY